MEEGEADGLTPDMIYRPKDLVWVKISGMWWPCQVMDQETLDPDVTEGLKKKPLVVVKFLEEGNTYEFVRSYDTIYHYNCKRKEEFLTLGFKKYFKLKNEKNMALFPTSIQEAERLTGGDPEIINDPKYLPQETQGPSIVDNNARSSLPADFKGKKSAASRRSAPGSSKDGDRTANGVFPFQIERPVIVKQGPAWYPYPQQISVVFARRHPPSDDPSIEKKPLNRCSLCCFETYSFDMLMLHHHNNQHNTSNQFGTYHWRNPLNKKKTTGSFKKTVVKRKKDGASASLDKGSAKKKKKSLPPVPVGDFTPKKPKVSSKNASKSLEVGQEFARKLIADWSDDEDENKPSNEAVDPEPPDCSASIKKTTADAAELGKDADEPSNSDLPAPKTDKPSETPKSSSCFDFDDEEPSEPGLQSSGKFGQIRLPRVITPEKSKPPDPLGDGNDIDSLLKEVSVPDIPSLPPSKQDSLFSRGDRTYGSSPFKDSKKPGATSPVKNDSNKAKNADLENNKNEEKHFLAKGPLQSKKRKSFGRTEGAEDGSDVENKSQAGAAPLKPSNERKVDVTKPDVADKTSAAEIAKQLLIDTLTYSPKPEDQVQLEGTVHDSVDETPHGKSRMVGEGSSVNRDTADVRETPHLILTSQSSSGLQRKCKKVHNQKATEPKSMEDEALPDEVSKPSIENDDSVQSTPKSSRMSGRKKSQKPFESPSLPPKELTKRQASPEDWESPGSTRKNKKLKSSRKVREPKSVQDDIITEREITQDHTELLKLTPDTPDSVLVTPNQSRKSRQKKERRVSRPVEESSAREASLEEPGSPRSSRRNKRSKSSAELTDRQVVKSSNVDVSLNTLEPIPPPIEEAPSDSIRKKSKKTKYLEGGDSEVQPKVLPEFSDSPAAEDAEPLKSPSAVGASGSVHSGSRKASRRKSTSQKPTESVERSSKREASPEEPVPPRSSRRSKKFKSSVETVAAVDVGSKVDIAPEGSIEPASSVQVTTNNTLQEPKGEKRRGNSKTKNLKSHETDVQLELLPEVSELPVKPVQQSALGEMHPQPISQDSTKLLESTCSEQVPDDVVREPEVKKSPRSRRGTKKLLPSPEEPKVQPEQPLTDLPSVPFEGSLESEKYCEPTTLIPSNDISTRRKPKKGRSSEEEKVQASQADVPEALALDSAPGDISSNTDITPNVTQSIKSPSSIPKEEPASNKSPRKSRKTNDQESSEGDQDKVVPSQDFEQFKSPREVAVKESPEIDEPRKSSRRSRRNSSQEVPVSIPLPSVDQKFDCSGSPLAHGGSKLISSSPQKLDNSLRTSRRSKGLNSQDVQVPTPSDGDFVSRENTSKTSEAIPEPFSSPTRDNSSSVLVEPLQDSSTLDESPKSNKKSKKIPGVEVPVSIQLPGKDLILDDSQSIRKPRESRACNSKALSEESPKTSSISSDLEKDTVAEKIPSTNENSTPAVLEDAKAVKPLQSGKKSKRHLPEEVSVHSEETSVVPGIQEGSQPMESLKDGPPVLIPEATATTPPVHSEEPREAAAKNSEPSSTSEDAESAIITGSSHSSGAHVTSRRSRRTLSQELLNSREADLLNAENKDSEQPSKKGRTSFHKRESEHKVESETPKLPKEVDTDISKAGPLEIMSENKLSKPQIVPSEEPRSVKSVSSEQESETLKSSSADNAKTLTEDPAPKEPLSRKSKRISSQEALTSKSVREIATPKTETKSSEQNQSRKKSKKCNLSREAEVVQSLDVESASLKVQEELKPEESSKDELMAAVLDAVVCNEPQPSAAVDQAVSSAPLKLPTVESLAPTIKVEDSKATEPLRRSRRFESQDVSSSSKTETAASESNHELRKLPCDEEALTSKVSVETVPLNEDHSSLKIENLPEAKLMLEDSRTEVPLRQEASGDLDKNVDELTKGEISSKPSSKMVSSEPDHKKLSSRVAEPKSSSKDAEPKEKSRKSPSRSHRHEKSWRGSRSSSRGDKDTSKAIPPEVRSKNEWKALNTESAATEKKSKDKDDSNVASGLEPASHVDVPESSLLDDLSASSDKLIPHETTEKPESSTPSIDEGKSLRLSHSENAAPSQFLSNDFFGSTSPRKKKSKWDVAEPKVEDTKSDPVKIMSVNSESSMKAGDSTPSALKPLEVTVSDFSKNEVAVDNSAVGSPKKQMAHSPSKTFRQDEAASLLEELLGSSPKSSPTSSPKKAKASSPVKVTLESPGLRSRTADIKFSLSPSKVLDFGSPPKANDSDNRTENLSLPPQNSAQSGLADSAAPIRTSRWDSPIRSSGIRSSTPTQSLAASPAKMPHSPGRKVKVWEIKSGAKSGSKSSLPKLPVHLEPDSSNNQSDDELSALRAEIMSYSTMDKAKSTSAPVPVKEVSELAKELEDPPDSQPQTIPAATSPQNKSCDSVNILVSPETIPLPPENPPSFKPAGLSEADLLANLSADAISFPLFEPGTSESITPVVPDATPSSKASSTPNFIVVRSDSTPGSDAISCVGSENQSLGNGLAQKFGGGADLREMVELIDINSIPIIIDEQGDSMMTYSEPPATEPTRNAAVPVSSIPLPGEKPFDQIQPISVVSSAPSISSPKVLSITVPPVQSISLPPEPKPPAPELQESKEEIIETEIVMDHAEIEQNSRASAQSVDVKFAKALVKQPWLRPDLLDDLTKRASGKKVYEVKKVTQLVLSLYDEDHPDYSYYMSLPPCQVGTCNSTPSWAATTPKNVPSATKSSPTANTRQTPTTNHSSGLGVDKSKLILTVAHSEKAGGERLLADSPKPGTSPAKASGAQVKQKIMQILNQFESGKYDADTARTLESITSRPGFLDKIKQQQKTASSQLPAEVPRKSGLTALNVVGTPLSTAKTVTSVSGSPAVASPKPGVVVSTSNARASQPKPNILSSGREPVKFTMESKFKSLQVGNSNPTKFVVVPDPVTGVPAVKQQFVRNASATQLGNAVSSGRIVTTQTISSASPGPGRSTVTGTLPTFTVISPKGSSTLQTVVGASPGRSALPVKAAGTPGSAVKVTTPLQRLKTVVQPAANVVSTSRLSAQPQTIRVRKQSLSGQTNQFLQRAMTGKETITYVTIPNMVIPTSSEQQVYVVTKKKPPAAPNSDILAEALAGAEIPLSDPSPELVSPDSVVIGADQLSSVSFDPAKTDSVNR